MNFEATKRYWVEGIKPWPEAKPFKFGDGSMSPQGIVVTLSHDAGTPVELRVGDEDLVAAIKLNSIVTITVEPFPGI
jgi:hypothetical protein